MHALIVIGIILVGLVYVVGVCTTLHDLLDTGKTLKEYREGYGKDLGMLVCCTYRGLSIFAWPLMGGVGFIIGLIRDVINLVFN